MTDGKARVQIADGPDLSVEAGEIVILPHGEAHVFCNGSPTQMLDGAMALRRHVTGQMSSIQWGGGAESTKFVCGFLGCERHADRLFLSGLPRTIKVDIRSDPTGAWLESSIRHLVSDSEHGAPGRDILLSKMSEALFIETMRRYMKSLPEDQTGWLAGARCDRGRRLDADPSSAIGTVDARRTRRGDRFLSIGLGRAVLATHRRGTMQLAARKLETTPSTVLQIAMDVGYESEAAFNRAFKREFGLPPAKYRKSCGGAISVNR